MRPWELLDTGAVPGDGAELRLLRRGDEFSIKSGYAELMNSRMHGSEDALAELACRRIAARAQPRLLIGGLGMGFTLAAALPLLGPAAEIVVAELVPAVVRWNQGPLAVLTGAPLQDPRVTVHEDDVGHLIQAQQAAFDAVLLDVDNGPEGLTRTENDALYSNAGLAAAKAALRPGGVLAVWSVSPAPAFSKRLRRAGFRVEEVRVRAHAGRGARHMIWLASKS
ncbi:spermidine synthase [Candidatus Tenderia electrophaga]|jgi:spermidine synthase|uniref:Spermidine synthase n=1 Tax=Candidatus Tenderia electrophaga TaxID=1748243 RepID=A0A0S2TDY2_9GAMM|nr:spermidine synthase [Candidatus Tenderia electrophaga]